MNRDLIDAALVVIHYGAVFIAAGTIGSIVYKIACRFPAFNRFMDKYFPFGWEE